MLCTGNAFHKHYMDSDLYYSHVYPWRDLSGYLSCWMCCYKCHIYTPECWCCRLSYTLSCVWWKRLYRHILCYTSYKQISWFCVAHLRALCSEPFPQLFSDKFGIPISFFLVVRIVTPETTEAEENFSINWTHIWLIWHFVKRLGQQLLHW